MTRLLGYNRMSFKGAQEPARRVLMKNIKMLSGDQCILLDSLGGELQPSTTGEPPCDAIHRGTRRRNNQQRTNRSRWNDGAQTIERKGVQERDTEDWRMCVVPTTQKERKDESRLYRWLNGI